MRVQILDKITKLEKENCEGCTIDASSFWRKDHYCLRECSVGAEICALGDELTEISKSRQKQTLLKGKDMTREEIKYLRNKGVSRKRIAKAIGIEDGMIKAYFDKIEGKISRGNREPVSCI